MGDGGQMDYSMFAARWEAEDQLPDEQQVLHKHVEDFDHDGLVIKTYKEGDHPRVQSASAGKSALDTTAQRGAANTSLA